MSVLYTQIYIIVFYCCEFESIDNLYANSRSVTVLVDSIFQ